MERNAPLNNTRIQSILAEILRRSVMGNAAGFE